MKQTSKDIQDSIKDLNKEIKILTKRREDLIHKLYANGECYWTNRKETGEPYKPDRFLVGR